MSIPKERLKQISIDIGAAIKIDPKLVEIIAKSIINQIEQESQVVGYRFDNGPVAMIDMSPHGGKWKKLVSLPLVDDELRHPKDNWKFTEDQRTSVCKGELCPSCLGTNIEYVGCAPDGLFLNKAFDCIDCGEKWEGY